MKPSTQQYDHSGKLKHLLSIADLKVETLQTLLKQADKILDQDIAPLKGDKLTKTLANLFFEPSTRTRCAFECAATQLGWHTLNFPASSSATIKGETMDDTLLTLAQMPIHAMAIRHEENHFPAHAAELIGDDIAIINAGDGTHEHPTQSLINMLAIQRAGLNFSELSIAIVGDIKHSRVAGSDLQSLHHLNVPDVRLVGPEALMPDANKIPAGLNINYHSDLNKGIQDADVILMLRVQNERIENTLIASLYDYSEAYCLKEESLAKAKPHAIILHPGPVNRNVEIADNLIYCPQSHILRQVRYGIAVRMALLIMLCDMQEYN